MPATILIADDEASIRDLVRLYLEKEGFRVQTADNGVQALEQARKGSPDLIVLDLMMPEMDGWEVCRRLRAESTLPILMLTARDQDIDKIVALEMGADDYLIKPFNPRELVARVRAILRRTSGGRPDPISRAASAVSRSTPPAARPPSATRRSSCAPASSICSLPSSIMPTRFSRAISCSIWCGDMNTTGRRARLTSTWPNCATGWRAAASRSKLCGGGDTN